MNVNRTRTPVLVRFKDVDMAGHVHNSIYLDYFEIGRNAFLDQFIPLDHDWRSTSMIVARNEVDHRGPIRFREGIEVETWCDRVGTSSFDLRYAVFGTVHAERTIRAEGKSVMVCFNLNEQHTIPLPAAWKEVLQKHIAS